jgi:hypothetical protein
VFVQSEGATLELVWEGGEGLAGRPVAIEANGAQIVSLPGSVLSYNVPIVALPPPLESLCVAGPAGKACCDFSGEPDCNENGLPDRCDILGGRSGDQDGDQVPDECQGGKQLPGDCNQDRDLDISDAVCLLGRSG